MPQFFVQPLSCNILTWQVEDLHSITPNHFLEVSGAVIHPLSYQQVNFYTTELSYPLFNLFQFLCHAAHSYRNLNSGQRLHYPLFSNSHVIALGTHMSAPFNGYFLNTRAVLWSQKS
jgi:hypothetical protein